MNMNGKKFSISPVKTLIAFLHKNPIPAMIHKIDGMVVEIKNIKKMNKGSFKQVKNNILLMM
ncbi:MAG: hypothetical protein H7122_04955 [Chitinophagaceae bacterium]|nr:hypothetical protein [Chitinophagaceae bacterium]